MDSRGKLRLVTFLTLVRFPMVALFFVLALVNVYKPHVVLFGTAWGLLILAALTDLVDGYLARKFEVTTRFGAHVDPLMDKLYYLTSLPLLVFVAGCNGHRMHAMFLLVLTVTFLARDQWVTFLRALAAADNVSGAANWTGKLRTSLNFPLICCIYFHEATPVTLFRDSYLYAFEALGLLVNVLSLYVYTLRYLPSLRKATGNGGM